MFRGKYSVPVQISQFIYGNSLVNFAGGSSESNVPYWLGLLSEAAGNSYAANGGYGFLRQFADRDQPGNEWGFEGVQGVWDTDVANFDEVSFDTVMITPGNFIQDRTPTQVYEGDTRSPLDATIDTVRDTMADQPGAQIFIYEGWADLGSNFGFPVSPSELDAYHAYNAGEYHDWYVDFTAQLNAAVPSADVQLIPVASVMAELFLDGPLDGLSLEDLYVDSAPHGTETVYFLASLITYPAVFGEAVPADYEVPEVVHPLVADNFEAINAQIVEILAADGVNTPEPVEPAPVEPEPVEPESIEPEPSEGPAQSDSAPVVQGESAEISQGDVAIIDVLANDSDIDGDALSLVHVGEASFGTVAIVNGQAVYTPDAGYVGSDAFEYIVTDGQNNYVEGSVSLQITASDAGAEPLPVEPDPMPETPEPIEPEPIAPEPAEPTPTPPAENASEGFTASYYELPTTIASLADVDFSAPPSATGIVNSLQYLEVNGSFVPESGEDHYAAQYASVLNVTEAGPHELFLVADDEARISFNGDVVFNATAAQAGDLVSVWLDLDAGNHEVLVQYLEVQGEQSLNLDWAGPSTDGDIEPLVGTLPSDAEMQETPEDQPEVEDIVEELPEEETEASPPEPQNSAKTDFNAKVFSTDETTLDKVDFNAPADNEYVTKGPTLASEDGALLEGGPDDGAVQFTTRLDVETAGLYEIGLSTDDQAEVSISGLPVVSADASDEGAAQSNSIFLIAGTHSVDVSYLDTGGSQSLNVTWSGPDTEGDALPLGDTPDANAVAALFSDDVAARADEEAFAIANAEADEFDQGTLLLF